MNDSDYSRFPRGEWKVSRKFHDYVIDRFSTVAAIVVRDSEFYRTLIALYRCYLENHNIPDGITDNVMALAVFETIRPEIDKAIVRSYNSRKAAAERRRRKAGEGCVYHAEELTEEHDDEPCENGYPTGYVFYLAGTHNGDPYYGNEDESQLPQLSLDIAESLKRRQKSENGRNLFHCLTGSLGVFA